MTRDELDTILDQMQQSASAGADPDLAAGLITVESALWVNHLSQTRATCSALHDALRYRDVQIHIAAAFETAVPTRAQAKERGAP